MELLQTAMNYHLGKFGVIFIAVTSVPVQLFNVSWNPVLCKRKCGISFRG